MKAISPFINLAQGFSVNISADWRNEVCSCEQHVGDTSSITRYFAHFCNSVNEKRECYANPNLHRAKPTGRRPFP